MKLSTKTYYGLRALIRLAKEKKPCSVKEVSRKEKIPEKYLEKIFQELRNDDFLVSTKGKTGGYALSRPAVKTKAGDIVIALEKDALLTKCQSSCPMAGKCSAERFWQEMQASFESSFGSTTLEDLAKNKKHGAKK